MRMGGYETPKEGEEAGSDNAATGDHIVDDEHDVVMEGEDDDIDLEELDENERAEFNELNRQLDELDKVLDSLEHKNDVIHSQLRQLLADSKEARQEMQNFDKPNGVEPDI